MTSSPNISKMILLDELMNWYVDTRQRNWAPTFLGLSFLFS